MKSTSKSNNVVNTKKTNKTNRKSGLLKRVWNWLKKGYVRAGAFGRGAMIAVIGYVGVVLCELAVVIGKAVVKNILACLKTAFYSPVFWGIAALAAIVWIATAIYNYGQRQYKSGARHAHATHADRVPKQSKQIEVPAKGPGLDAQPEADEVQ